MTTADRVARLLSNVISYVVGTPLTTQLSFALRLAPPVRKAIKTNNLERELESAVHQPSIHGTLMSIQVGLPTTHRDDQGEWTTGFYKQPVSGPVTVDLARIDGDGQADLEHHGGVDKAVLAYPVDHFDDWLQEFQTRRTVDRIPYGGFGENLSITGLDEKSVCIGDVWSVGTVLFEVSQPRQPCWKLARRWNFKELPKLVVQSARSGWYFRVKRTGQIQANDVVDLVSRPNPQWTVHVANRVFYGTSRDERRQLAQVPGLSAAWQKSLQ